LFPVISVIPSKRKRIVSKRRFLVVLAFLMLRHYTMISQDTFRPVNTVMLNGTETPEEVVRKAARVVPSPRQLAWQELEFTAFIHFTINTFTDREWGEGTESATAFNPTSLDARQWAKVCKDAGMKMLIVTAKHHDGFCLWPTAYSDHSVRNSPWRNGRGDMIKEVSAACREVGLKFGIYLSPWDRHEKSYGNSPIYNEHFKNQLRELLTGYGEVSEVWFDGACGEGPNGKRQVYDWQGYYRLVRELQPGAVIAIMGPDVRWVGTESGFGRETEWSAIPFDTMSAAGAGSLGGSQNPDDSFVPMDRTEVDLGSRDKLRNARMLRWYPAEVDVSIRPGWFYHASEDNRVKSPEQLLDIFYSSVGRNAVLLLNIPPDRRGLVHENDVRSLAEMRRVLDATFKRNMALQAKVTASDERAGQEGMQAVDGNQRTSWSAHDIAVAPSLVLDLTKEQVFDVIMLQEDIRLGQRVEAFSVERWVNQTWEEIARGTTIGYKRLLRVPSVAASRVRLTISSSRDVPAISEFALFKQPPSVQVRPVGGPFRQNVAVTLTTNRNGASIRYTLDGSEPSESSSLYRGPLEFHETTHLRAVAFDNDGVKGVVTAATYSSVAYDVSFKRLPSSKYPGSGPLGLTDGVKGDLNHEDPAWQGYEGTDLEAVVDLGSVKNIRRIGVDCLQNKDSWIFFPEYVEYSFSENGTEFSGASRIVQKGAAVAQGAQRADFVLTVPGMRARYVKVVAKNIGVCPPGHPGAGGRAWLFVDEIVIDGE
jgi:alpha-L-fucosidase